MLSNIVYTYINKGVIFIKFYMIEWMRDKCLIIRFYNNKQYFNNRIWTFETRFLTIEFYILINWEI